jgi:WG containing repeat
MTKWIKYLICCLFLTTAISHASKIKKGFEALEIFNYFEAKRLFEKKAKKHPVPAYYGLSIIYARKDNPFSNLDSAHAMISRSFEAFSSTKEKWKIKYEKLGVDSNIVSLQRNHISDLFYVRAKDVNSIFGYQDFIDRNSWSQYVDSATALRNELAFEQAKQRGSASDYAEYLNLYPNSDFSEDATDLFHSTNYAEQTQNNNFIDFVNFVQNNSESPFMEDAEDKIYEMSTATGSETSYRNFIIDYPSNHNVKKAWIHLYNARMKEKYSSENILAFSNEYPDYPYKDDLMKEYNMADKVFYPIKTKGKWGYCDRAGNILIDPKFESVEWYQEGLSVFRKGQKFGFLNKLGKVIIQPIYDDALPFNEGHALVELDELWGLIDRNGEYVIPAQYEDLGELKNGLCYFQEGDNYGYFDANGIVRLKPQYSEAYGFENGHAVVSKNDYYGVIDTYGTTYLPYKFDEIFHYNNEYYCASYKDYWGIISLKSDTLLSFEYDYVGRFDDGYSIVELDDEFNFLDEKGQFVFEEWIEVYPEHRQLASFKNGYAKVKFEKGYNLVDTAGVKLLRKEVQNVGGFSDVIAVQKDDMWGYQDKMNKKILEYDFEHAYSFIGESAVIFKSPFFGLINRSGEYIIAPFQEELKFINDSTLISKRMGKYGMMSVAGDTLLTFQYNKIEPISDSVVSIEEGSELFYYNLKSRTFIRREE